jgi:hypothetical protein
MIKKGSTVKPFYTGICNAPVESVDVEGVVVDVLDGVVDGVRYHNKYEVMFLEPIGGYRTWLYDYNELDLSDEPLVTMRRENYKYKL